MDRLGAMFSTPLFLFPLGLALAQDLPSSTPEPVPTVEAVPAPVHRGTVIFIHGLYLNSRCWDGWVQRFEAAGYTVLAPDYAGHVGEPAALRANIPAELRQTDLTDAVDQMRALVKASPEPPILIGHSMGGLIVQILLSEGLGAAGVAIDSAPPKGSLSLAPSFARANAGSLTPGHKPILLSPKQFRYAFANDLSLEEATIFYDKLVVPESRRTAHGPLTGAAKVDFDAKHAPLLMFAGGNDHVIPPGLNRRNAGRYDPANGTVDIELLEGRTHLTIAEPGWEAVADRALAWIASVP